MAAPGVESPLQLIAFDDERAGDQPVPLPQRRITDVDQQATGSGGRVRLLRREPVESEPYALQQLVDAHGLVVVHRLSGGHCQSSGRSTDSSRSTSPVRL